jgi:hypothetical protein
MLILAEVLSVAKLNQRIYFLENACLGDLTTIIISALI